MTNKVITSRRASTVRKLVRELPGILSGRLNNKHRIRDVFLTSLTRNLFEVLHTSYLQRSLGQADKYGQQFPELTKSTISKRPARRRKNQSDRGLLTDAQNKQWKAIYAVNVKRLIPILGLDEGAKQSAKIAWAVLKDLGAKTKLEVLGNREVKILRVTGQLLDSFQPTKVGKFVYSPRKNQFATLTSTSLAVGTTVEHAKYVFDKRPLVTSSSVGDSMVTDAVSRAIEDVVTYLGEILAG